MPPKQETFYTITAARASDLEHFFAGSIAVGAGEQSRSRRREPGRGDGRDAGCEKRAVDEQVRGCAECARTQGDREHLSAGSIAVGAGEQSRSRRREPGCGDGREAGCEKRAVDEQVRGCAECAWRGAIRSTCPRGVSRWERGSNRGAGGGSPGAEMGGRRDVKNGRRMSGRGDALSARGRGGDPEHFFAGSIAVGAEWQSRSRRRECGGGCGGVGKERAGVSVGGGQSVKNEWQMSRRGDMREGRGSGEKRELSGAGAGKILICD